MVAPSGSSARRTRTSEEILRTRDRRRWEREAAAAAEEEMSLTEDAT